MLDRKAALTGKSRRRQQVWYQNKFERQLMLRRKVDANLVNHLIEKLD